MLKKMKADLQPQMNWSRISSIHIKTIGTKNCVCIKQDNIKPKIEIFIGVMKSVTQCGLLCDVHTVEVVISLKTSLETYEN